MPRLAPPSAGLHPALFFSFGIVAAALLFVTLAATGGSSGVASVAPHAAGEHAHDSSATTLSAPCSCTCECAPCVEAEPCASPKACALPEGAASGATTALATRTGKWLPSSASSHSEFYDVFLPSAPPACQTLALPWNDGALTAAEVAIAKPFSLVSPPRLRLTHALTLAALALPVGDIVETGVFTGGATGLMLRVLAAYDGCARRVWAFDSFQGLPAADKDRDTISGVPSFPELHPQFQAAGIFSAGEDLFRANLKTMGALDPASPTSVERLVVTKGYFNDTCAVSPVGAIAFLRLDGDLFVSTWDPLVAFYDRVVPGGYIYVDDYLSFPGCADAVDTFRWQRGIAEPLRYVREDVGRWQNDASRAEAAYWRKRG